ncbi:MAG: hypothetical protein N3D15_03705 [Syntrophorhabdaceae bacterium]|nr:hypothetical protein [Syntrophorhabdaceae bacterium]
MKKMIIFIFLLSTSFVLQPDRLIAQGKEMTPEEFVAYNLKKTRERLEELKKKHGREVKEFVAGSKALISVLPKPHTLQFIYETTKPKIKKDEIKFPSDTQFFPSSISIESINAYTLAADDFTSYVLRIPKKAYLSITQRGLFSNKQKSNCCTNYRFINKQGDFVCENYASTSFLSAYNIDPRGVIENFNLWTSGGGTIGGKEYVNFNKPGRGIVKAILPAHYSDAKEEIIPITETPCMRVVRSDLPKPGTKDVHFWTEKDNETKITVRWQGKNRGNFETQVDFDVLSFEGIKVDGNEFRDAGKETDGVDIFVQGSNVFPSVELGSSYEPVLIIRRAAKSQQGRLSDAVITSFEPASKWLLSVTYNISNEGPFVVTQRGVITPLSTGETRLMMNVGKVFYLYRKITANRWSYEMDTAPMEGRASPNILYRIMLNVQGPADMKSYNVKWEGNGLKWQTPNQSFVRKGDRWVSENYFSVADDVKKGDKTEIKIYVDNVKKGTRAFELIKRFEIYPNIFSIALELAAKGQPPTSQGIDLFYPNFIPDGNTFRAYLKYMDKDGKEININEIKNLLTKSNLTLLSETPAVAQVFSGGGQVGTAIGDSMISCQLDLGDRKLISKWVKVTANKIMLTKGESQGWATYIIRVIGPADMSKYQAVFYHNKGTQRAIFVRANDGSQSAGISTVEKIEKVEILKDGKAVAMMPVADHVVLPEPGIKLLPIKLPGKVIDTITPVDMGSLTSTADCRNMLRKQFPEYYGSAPDDVLNPICQGMREKEKEEIKEQRATDKAQLEILKALKKEGRRLMVFSDSTEIAAVVSGNFDPQRTYCRWRIDKGGSLKVERPQTDIVRIGIDGACYNKITGFQGDFDTNALASVELVYAYPPMQAGKFITGTEAPMGAFIERKAIEEWVNR